MSIPIDRTADLSVTTGISSSPPAAAPPASEALPKTEAKISAEQMVKSLQTTVPSAHIGRSAIPTPTERHSAIALPVIALPPKTPAQLGEMCKELRMLIGGMNYDRAKIGQLMTAVNKSPTEANRREFGEKIEKLMNTHIAGTRAIAGSAAPRAGPPKHLANGAVKQVWARENVTDKVFYTALAGNSAAQKELESEVATTLDIQKNLKKNVLYDFLKDQILLLDLKPDTVGYLSTFASVKDLKNEILKAGEHHKDIPDADLLKLKAYFGNKEKAEVVDKAMARGDNIAINIRVVEEKEKIQGQYTLEAVRADGDLEKLLRHPEWYTPADLVDITFQVLNGMADLHKAGYVHGDIKPENVLVTWKDGRWHAMISDFGKAKRMDPHMASVHVGNTRFAPWEGRLSMAGDVCSTGIKLIRILEQHVLAHKRVANPGMRSLITPARPGFSKAASSPGKLREGFEVFVIESADFNAIEANHTRSQKVRSRIFQGFNMVVNNRAAKQKKIAVEKDRYIDALAAGLQETGFAEPAAIGELCAFLKQMTDIDPAKRPTMDAAQAKFVRMKAKLPS